MAFDECNIAVDSVQEQMSRLQSDMIILNGDYKRIHKELEQMCKERTILLEMVKTLQQQVSKLQQRSTNVIKGSIATGTSMIRDGAINQSSGYQIGTVVGNQVNPNTGDRFWPRK